jgi:hypothetical protein
VGNHDTLLRDYPDGVYSKLVKQQQDAEHNNDDGVPGVAFSDVNDVNLDVEEVDGNIDINLTRQYTTGRMRQSTIIN